MVNPNTTIDGGYYAIKGFEFQIDKTMLEILSSDNENESINIEQIQDIDSRSFVIQVKYKDTQKFTPSKIKEPIIQLLEEFRRDENKSYYLYAYFNNFDGFNNFTINKKITATNLERILGGKKDIFTTKEKNDFINKFYLDFAPTLQDQFEQVISKLKELVFVGSSTDEAIFYYASIADYLRKLVINHKRASDRVCTKKQVLNYVRGGKKLIFNSAFKEYKGEEKYLKYVKSKFVKLQKKQENVIFIGNINLDRAVSISNLLMNITNKYFRGATYDVKPLTFIIPDEVINEVKEDLIEEEVIFNDGFEHIKFSEKIFFKDPIRNKKKTANGRCSDSLGKISYNLRILSESKFKKISDYMIKPKMIYYFDCEISNRFEPVSFTKIDGLNSGQISDLFNF